MAIRLTHFTGSNLKRSSVVLVIIAILSLGIGYLISPKLIFQPITYNEGDIILQTIHITEDLLIPDKVSTKLKLDRLLQDQRRIYDYDPQIFEKTQKTIQDTFNTNRETFAKLYNQEEDIVKENRRLGLEFFKTVLNLQKVDKQIEFYTSYQIALREKLQFFEQEGALTTKGFERKAKTDADYNIVDVILTDLQEKRKYFQLELDRFNHRFSQLEAENKALLLSIEEKRRELVNGFDKSLTIELTDAERQLLDFPFYSFEIETQLLILISEVLTKKIVVSKEILPTNKDKLEIRNLVTGETSVSDRNEEFLDLSEARQLIGTAAKATLVDDETGKKKNLLIILGQKLIRPTVFENKLEYENRKAQLISNTSPVFFSVKKGEIIARAGDRATKSQVDLINSYYELVADQDKLPGTIGVVLFVLISLILVSSILSLPNLYFKVRFRYHLLVMSAVLITLILVKGGALLGELVETRYFNIQSQVYNLILPATLGSMLVGILLSFEAGLLTGLLAALFCSIMMQSSLYFFVYVIMGSIVASMPMTKFDSRYSILLHGLKVSAINVPMMVIIHLIESNQIGTIGWFSITAAILSGVIAAIFTSILLPFFESVFDITTNLKLLELSNMNHPALKELILKAPGTYQHSIIVGNLAESGASKIGANPLLSRIAAYYHDIGKASDAHYYIENQSPNLPNIHDSIDPQASAEIIISHLHKGAEISEKYRLGKAIKDILLQHHGTNIVKYFYNKAMEQNNKNASGVEILEKNFRYPGPKPQNLEAALVMLADVSEACCRSLENPTPEMVKDVIKKVCWNMLVDGQLDQSGLTLQNYHTVVDVYSTMLISFYHQRIKYPDAKPITGPQPVLGTRY